MTSMTVDNVMVRQDGGRHLGTDGTSGWIWFAAKQLEQHLLRYFADRTNGLSGLRVLELGSGTGWLSLRLAVRGATVTATDQSGAVPILLRNVFHNQELFMDRAGIDLEVDIQTLSWETHESRISGKWDVFIGSDLLYLKESYLPLLQTCIRHDCERLIFSWEQRKPEEEGRFESLAEELGFELVYLVDAGENPSTSNPVWIGNWIFVPKADLSAPG